jgi:DNA-binding transcriptional ArsR family regulator
MELIEAVRSLAALAQPARLGVFRLLVRGGEGGVCAGELARRLGLPKPTLSFHLKELANAGLVEAVRDGRSLIYRLRPEGMRDLMGYLTEDCCQGRPELCLPAGCGEGACAGSGV